MGCRGTQGAEVALPRGRAQEGLIHAAALAQAAVEADIPGHSPAARPLCPEAERAGASEEVRGGHGRLGFVLFCCLLPCKETCCWFLPQNAQLSPALVFPSILLPGELGEPAPWVCDGLAPTPGCPRPRGSSPAADGRLSLWEASGQGRQLPSSLPPRSGLCTPVAGGRPPPRGPEAVASCRPSPCSPRSAVCRPCRASCLSPRLPSASSPVAQTGPSGGDCGFRPGGPAVSRGPRLSASPRVATARAARLGGGKAAG